MLLVVPFAIEINFNIKWKTCTQILLTFSSSTGPKHSVIGEMINAVKTMASVIFTEFSSLSPFSWDGSRSLSKSDDSIPFNLSIWALTICMIRRIKIEISALPNKNFLLRTRKGTTKFEKKARIHLVSQHFFFFFFEKVGEKSICD